jgi:hypothetical protein
MSARRVRRSVVLAALALVACGGVSALQGPEAGSTGDAGVSAAATIGPAGGVVSLGQASVTIPPLALSQATTITITLRSDEPPAEYRAYSPFYEFDPRGLTFAVPATVVLPDYGGPQGAAIYWSSPTGPGYDVLPTTLGADVGSAQVTHFSTGFLGIEMPVDASSGDALTGDGGPSEDGATSDAEPIDATVDAGDGAPQTDASGDGPQDSTVDSDDGQSGDATIEGGSDAPVDGGMDSSDDGFKVDGSNVCPASDAASDASDAGVDPDGGCQTPYTPALISCGHGDLCNLERQICCFNDSCEFQGQICNFPILHCDGPEDCGGTYCGAVGQNFSCTGNSCAKANPQCPPSSSCACHSDADCPANFPYCSPSPCGAPLPLCTSIPLSSDGGAPAVCSVPGPPSNFCISCGGATCAGPTDICCMSGSASCMQGSCNALPMECDGPEDCGPGMTCCAAGFGSYSVFCSTACGTPIDMQHDASIVCHTDADCPNSLHCLPFVPQTGGTILLCGG